MPRPGSPAARAAGGVYGNNALAQTYSVANGGKNGAPAGVTVVPRVVADISYNGTVDTSTSLINIDNENNPRSVATTDGTSFYVSGQGKKGDTTEGVFRAPDGANNTTPTAINTATDTRTAELYNGTLYVSADSSAANGGNAGAGNISSYGMSPTGATTATPLPGITGQITLTAAQENSVNSSAVGSTVDISPENFYFANSTTLYVADSGNPKGGTLGDGGLQKWTFNGSTWSLQYTVSAGLNLVPNTTADPGAGQPATTGLIGLTGVTNADGTVTLYATNATIGDLNTTGLYKVTDTLAATAPTAGEQFTELVAAPADTNIRGVAFAPAAAVACYVTGTRIRTTRADVPVEALRVGDLAVTASGHVRPITWIGHREVDCTTLDAPSECWPVRVIAGAFGADLPERDLWLSPGHPVVVGSGTNEHLVPIMCLINGTSIARMPAETVTYWHIELDSHDILLAEGLPAESFLDFGNRQWFGADAEAHVLANPDFIVPGLAARCRPVAIDGPLVEAERRRLDALFVAYLSAQCAWASTDLFAALPFG